MKTVLALIVGWFMGIFTVAMVVGRVLADLAAGDRQFIDAKASAV